MASFLNRLRGRHKKPALKPKADDKDEKLTPDWASKKKILAPYLHKNRDLVFRPIVVKGDPKRRAAVVYLEGRVDYPTLHEDILKSLMLDSDAAHWRQALADTLIDRIQETCLTVGQVQKVNQAGEMVQAVFDGLALVIIDGISEALVLDIRGGEHRAPDEPPAERTLHGSREGFIEDLGVNISMVRRRLRDPNLVVEKALVGKRTRTDVAILYIEDIADPEIVNTVREKIKQINIDGIANIGYIEQFLTDASYSPFPQLKNSERPDKVVMELLEGRVAIMAAGTPGVLTAPSLFVSFLQASEDYYDRTVVGSFNRIFRHLAFILAVSLPALYIALLSFQPELIPYELFIVLAQARSQVPFPILVEVLIQEIIIQLVVETGLRLPTSIGQTVGVVAGIVLGQAAISANIASPAIIMVITITTIATFSLPNYSMVLATRLIRLVFILAASVFGLFGFSIGWFLLITHLVKLESLGVPYFSPYGPMRFGDLQDSFFRSFIWRFKYRPRSIPQLDRRRQGEWNG